MMQSGEAQVQGASQQNSSAVLKSVGKKGGKMSLVQMLFGTVSAGGKKTTPFGKVLGQLQGEPTLLVKSQSRLPADLNSLSAPKAGAKTPVKTVVGKSDVGSEIGEAAMLLTPKGKKVTLAADGIVAPAPPNGRAEAGTPTGSATRTSQPPERKTLASQKGAAAGSDQSANTTTIGGAIVTGASDLGSELIGESSDGNPSSPESAGAESALSGEKVGRAETVVITTGTTAPSGADVSSIAPKQTHTSEPNGVKVTPTTRRQTLKRSQTETVPSSTPTTVQAKAGTSDVAVAREGIDSATADKSPDAHSTQTPSEGAKSTGKAELVPRGGNQTEATDSSLLSTSSLKTPGTSDKVQPLSHLDGAETQVKRPDVVPSQALRATAPQATPRQATAQKATAPQATPRQATAQEPTAPQATTQQATAQETKPGDLVLQRSAPDSESVAKTANAVAETVGETGGESKRLEDRSGRSSRSNITFVKNSDPDQVTRSSDAPKGAAQRPSESRLVAQSSDGRPQSATTATLANPEPVNSLTAEDLTVTPGAGNGSEGLKIAKPAEIGLQGQVETMGRETPVSTTQTPTLTQTTVATPGLANLAKMTVHYYSRFVNGNQNQHVFQTDGGALGNVKITFANSDAGVTLSIVVDSPEAQQQLHRALPQLQQEWGNLNLNLGQVNVQVGDSNQKQAFKGEESRPDGPKMQSTEEMDIPVEMSMLRTLSYGYNTVEFVA